MAARGERNRQDLSDRPTRVSSAPRPGDATITGSGGLPWDKLCGSQSCSPWEAGYPIVDMRSIRLKAVSAPVRISELSIASLSEGIQMETSWRCSRPCGMLNSA